MRVNSFLGANHTEVFFAFQTVKLIFLGMIFAVLQCVDSIYLFELMRMHEFLLVVIIAALLTKVKFFIGTENGGSTILTIAALIL